MVAGSPSGERTGSGLQAGSSAPGIDTLGAVGPTRAELEAARELHVPDVLARGRPIVFVGINPGLYSAAVGHHFARPGNRFWKALHLGGFTDRVLDPSEDRNLPSYGVGITNLVDRATAAASELSSRELRAGAVTLERKVRRFRPAAVAVLGVTAYRAAFERKDAALGRQREDLAGAALWVLPNPSGLNAHHQLDDLAARFAELRRATRSGARSSR
jgi:TDG/mug DNA glycosylase family protein